MQNARVNLPLVLELVPAPDAAECCERLVGLPWLLFLDSAARARGGRYSYVTADPVLVLRDGEGDGPLFDRARAVLDPYRMPRLTELPPFQGGLAGYIGYELGARWEGVPGGGGRSAPLPDAALALYDWVLAWDHEAECAWLISTGLPFEGSEALAHARRRLEEVREWLARRASARQLRPGLVGRLDDAPDFPVDRESATRSNFTRDRYMDAVARTREYILAGDIFQANLSQRLRIPLVDDPWPLYRRLRLASPAPFAAYLDLPELSILSVSPERFVRRAGNEVESRPIKGTRPRGRGAVEDDALARALLASVKDRAENVMIVDLLRNDLSRVCEPGSVRASELFTVERIAGVQHLVSTVLGRLSGGLDAFHLLEAALPGGSITGAPKIRAMEIIAELENVRRGPYCGAIGYVSVTGDMDTSIVIRTALATRSDLYLSLGGGIVADSDPAAEYRETMDKGRAILSVLGPSPAVAGAAS